MYYEQLKAGVIQHDLLVDSLIYKVRSSTPIATTATTVAASMFKCSPDTPQR